MTMLAVAPPWTTVSSSNLRRTTSVLPIAIDRPSSSLPKKAVNARRQQTASAEISIASDAPQCPTSRGFLPWRFADAGPGVRGAVIMGPASENLHISGSVGPSASCLLYPPKADIAQDGCHVRLVPKRIHA